MKRIVPLLAAAALLALPALPAAAATAAEQQGPGGFVVWELHQVNARSWGKIWKRIHPAQRKHVDAVLYVLCNVQIETGWKFAKIQVTGVRDVRASVPGTALKRRPAKAVSVRMTMADQTGHRVLQKQTVNVFSVKGVWYSALNAQQFKAYKAGKCLGPKTTTSAK